MQAAHCLAVWVPDCLPSQHDAARFECTWSKRVKRVMHVLLCVNPGSFRRVRCPRAVVTCVAVTHFAGALVGMRYYVDAAVRHGPGGALWELRVVYVQGGRDRAPPPAVIPNGGSGERRSGVPATAGGGWGDGGDGGRAGSGAAAAPV